MARPSSVPQRTCSRSMAPVEICGIPSQRIRYFACVPLPEPGEPNKTMASARVRSSGPRACGLISTSGKTINLAAPPANTASAWSEALVVAHNQLGFHLVDGIHGHADHDQQRGTAEVELHVHAVQNPAREIGVDKVAHERQVIEVNAAEHDVRNQAEEAKVDDAHQRVPGQIRIHVIRSAAAGAYAGDESTV